MDTVISMLVEFWDADSVDTRKKKGGWDGSRYRLAALSFFPYYLHSLNPYSLHLTHTIHKSPEIQCQESPQSLILQLTFQQFGDLSALIETLANNNLKRNKMLDQIFLSLKFIWVDKKIRNTKRRQNTQKDKVSFHLIRSWYIFSSVFMALKFKRVDKRWGKPWVS